MFLGAHDADRRCAMAYSARRGRDHTAGLRYDATKEQRIASRRSLKRFYWLLNIVGRA
jgi:hypothetical protein